MAAVMAALDAACTAAVYEYDEVPGSNHRAGTEPEQYLVVSVERRFNSQLRSVARTGRTGWRVAVRSTAKNIEDVERGLAQASAALNEQRLTVDAGTTTPVQFEAAEAASWDEPRYTAVATYTYAH